MGLRVFARFVLATVFSVCWFGAAAEAQEAVTAPVSVAGSVTAAATPAPEPISPANSLSMDNVEDFAEFDLAALLDAQVETASKKSESISRAPAIIEVLTREQLYSLGARDLYTALSFLPGIEIIETHSGLTTVVMRGFMQEQYSVKVLMLINGHPSYEPVTSTFYLEAVPFEAIDHIEVIRGPGSVLYGANAYTGVINIITVSQKEDGLSTVARVEAGQYTTGMAGAGNQGRSGALSWAVFSSAVNGRGFPYHVRKIQNADCTVGPAPIPYDCKRPGEISRKLSYYNNYENAFGSVQFHGLRVQLGGVDQSKAKLGANPMPRLTGPQNNQHVWGDVSYEQNWETLRLLARAGVDRDQRKWGIGHFPLPSFEETHTDNLSYLYRGELSASWSPIEQLTLDIGAAIERGESHHFDFVVKSGGLHFLSPKFSVNPWQQTLAGYSQLNWRLSDSFLMLAGIRVSRFQTTSARVTVDSSSVQTITTIEEDPQMLPSPRGGIVFTPREDLAFKLLYGEAFRLPNLLETNAVLKTYLGSTPNLKPEAIRTAELGVDSRPLPWLSLRTNGYYSLLDDLIIRRQSSSADEVNRFGVGAGLYSNTLKGKIFGAEFSTTAILNDALSLFANVSAKRTLFEMKVNKYSAQAGNYRRPDPAPLTANAGFSWKAASWLVVRPNGQFIGPRTYAHAYTLLNAVLDFPVTQHVTLSAIGNNLLDVAYDYPEIVSRYTPTIPGGANRSLFGRITAAF